ncbi:hypothetical protein EVAR_14933_1 [Eumeta japonica]|uniref:PiggyBac transposable element-derived protein domain-containing protein n=1 Tax=Eumeta variegata TaxID=151549 RepID=A0A4C1XP61_EUMVA|nr:hypothetical protein EVAR_14933_1 [Eumeta japonica]
MKSSEFVVRMGLPLRWIFGQFWFLVYINDLGILKDVYEIVLFAGCFGDANVTTPRRRKVRNTQNETGPALGIRIIFPHHRRPRPSARAPRRVGEAAKTREYIKLRSFYEEDVFGGEDDADEGAVYPDERSEHNTNSEQECDDNDLATTSSDHQQASESSNNQYMDVNSSHSDENIPLINMALQNFYVVKKRDRSGNYQTICKWRKSPYLQGVKTRRQKIVTEQSGPQHAARETNYERQRDCEETNIIELKALIGSMNLIGIHKSSHVLINDIWMADGTELDKCSATMSKQRFRFLLSSLRFDDIHTRQERNSIDKLPPIREIYEPFVIN